MGQKIAGPRCPVAVHLVKDDTGYRFPSRLPGAVSPAVTRAERITIGNRSKDMLTERT